MDTNAYSVLGRGNTAHYPPPYSQTKLNFKSYKHNQHKQTNSTMAGNPAVLYKPQQMFTIPT